MNSEFYTNERVTGHSVSADYEIFESRFLGGKKHRIRITESDVDWDDSREVTLTPEEFIFMMDDLIEHHREELIQLYENRSPHIEGSEESEMAKKLLNKND